MRFTRHGAGVEADPDEVEAGLLRRLVSDLMALLEDAPPTSDDPLEAALGLPAGEPGLPDDPALARLFPDAYADDDALAAANKDFRRYTESDLRAGKKADAAVVLTTLPPGGRLRLDRTQARAWLGCLNDLRLVLGARLEVTEDDEDPDELDPEDPRAPALQLYGWLGWLQESLVRCLMGTG